MDLVYTILSYSLAIIGATAALFYWYFSTTFDTWEKKGVPYLKPTFFFGNVADLMLLRKSISETFGDLYHKTKEHKYVGIFQGRTPTLMVNDPEMIKTVFTKDFHYFQDRGVYIPKKQILGQHLFSLSGSQWKTLRTKLSPTFTSGKMKMMFEFIEECSNKVVKFVENNAKNEDILEMREVLAKYSTDVIATCAFGLQVNALDNEYSDFRRMGKLFFRATLAAQLKRSINFFIPDLAKWLDLDDFHPDIAPFFLKVIKETVDHRMKNNIVRNDFLQLMINLKYKGYIDNEIQEKTNEEFTLDDGLFAAQVFVFFIAGFETSSTAMSFALYELALNSDVQTRLQKEIDTTMQQNGGKLTYDSVMNMKYLDQVVCETLRKYSPVPILFRVVTTPYTIPGTKVSLEKDTKIAIAIHGLHYDPQHYPNPNAFDPERFNEENKKKRHHYAYLPFGEGPRNCIGMRFGLLQTKMGIASLLSNYTFSVCSKTEIPIRLDPLLLVTGNKDGISLQIKMRN